MINVNTENFEKEVTNSTQPVMIDFWAPWCGPCKTMAPEFEKASLDLPNIKFVKINVDDAPELSEKYKVMGIPTVVLVNNNETLFTNVGSTTSIKLKDLVNKALEN